jgi:hypothetical protein
LTAIGSALTVGAVAAESSRTDKLARIRRFMMQSPGLEKVRLLLWLITSMVDHDELVLIGSLNLAEKLIKILSLSLGW